MNDKIASIDSFLSLSRDVLNIPGMSVAVIYDGQPILTKGYGVLDHVENKTVTEDSQFAIASSTKPFTTFLLGTLVDEGCLNWDDLVIDHIPEFRMNDEYRTQHVTVRDLVAHRTGQPRHDAIWIRANFSRDELLKRIPYLQPNSQFRQKWQYTNVMFTIGGIIAERITGQSWEDLIKSRIFSPLGMTRSDCSIKNPKELTDVATPHSENTNGEAVPVAWQDIFIVAPGGSIVSTAKDMAKWIQVQLKVSGLNIIQDQTLDEMHTIQMAVDCLPGANKTLIGYGLGWCMGYYRGRYLVWHNGEVDGFSSYHAILPEENIGVVILMNSDSHLGFLQPTANRIFDILLDYPVTEPEEWVSDIAAKEQQTTKGTVASNDTFDDVDEPEQYAGKFFNPGYNFVEVFLLGNQLYASHNDNRFLLKPKKGRDFFGAFPSYAPPVKRVLEFDCSFLRDPWGDVSAVLFNFEFLVPPIRFEKEVSPEFYDPAYLRKFIGSYENPALSTTITLDPKNRLMSSLGELIPWKRNIFSLKPISNSFFEFIPSNDGKNSTLNVHRYYQVYPLELQEVSTGKWARVNSRLALIER